MATDEFQDFTYASHWEKLAGEIEQTLRRWLWTREGTLTKDQCQVELKQKLHFRKEPYVLSLQVPDGLPIERESTPLGESGVEVASNELQGSSISCTTSEGDDSEAFEFLPEVKEAAVGGLVNHSNPAFSTELLLKPSEQFDDTLHDLQRWFGVTRFTLLRPSSQSGRILDSQEASSVLSAAAVALSEFGRSIPIFIPVQDSYRDAYKGVAVVDGHSVFFDVDSSHMTQVPDHLRSVLGQLQVFSRQLTGYSTHGARLCEDIACGVETKIEDYEIGVSSCVIYTLPDPVKESNEEEEVEGEDEGGWDDGCVWQPWAAHKNPVASLELDLVWEDVELSSEDPTPTLSAMNANIWKLHALQIHRSAFVSWSIFAKKSSFERRHLQFPFDEVENSRSCFSRLLTLLQGVHLASQAHSIGDLDSEDWWEEIGSRMPTIPPDSLFDDSIHDLFGDDFTGKGAYEMTQHVTYKDAAVTVDRNDNKGWNRVPGFDTLTSRFALHCVVYRNARAVALLWGHFVQAIRLHFWEKLKMIPVTFGDTDERDEEEPQAPELNTCLIHQKLQMLNICIHRLTQKRFVRASELHSTPQEGAPNQPVAKGVAGVLTGAYLEDCPEVPVNIPLTQPLPVHTSDSLAEEASVLSALHESPEDRERASREQAKVLISDMAAFKAANPQGQLSDFVKWHSPKDWVQQENGEGHLSQRMSHENDNKWRKLWMEVEPCPANEQLPLFDPALAGERALYFLETIEPSTLFQQLFQTALASCFGLLERSPHALQYTQVKTILEQFYKHLKEELPQMEAAPELAFPLLSKFKVAEMSVVLGESLHRRLPNCQSTIELLLDQITPSLTPDASTQKAPQGGSTTLKGVTVPYCDRESILGLLLKEEAQSDTASNEAEGEGVRRVLSGTALQHEWVVNCSKKATSSTLSHRLYFKDASHEVRLGSVLISEL